MPIHNFKSILLILVVTVCTLAALPGLLASPQLDPSLTPSRRGRWNVFGLLTGDYLHPWLFCRSAAVMAARSVTLIASAAAKETKGRDFSRPQAGIAGSLLQAVLEVNPGAIVQVDPKVVSIAWVKCAVVLSSLIKYPLLSSCIPTERSVRRC